MPEPHWLSDRELAAWRAFLTMEEDVRRHMNRHLLTTFGLSVADYAVLVGLSDAPDSCLRVFELRELLRWEKTRLTHQISRMVERDLVERRSCESEPRGAVVALTAAGREAIVRAAPAHAEFVRRLFFDALSPRQVDALAAISNAVLENIADGMGDTSPTS
ncbi:MarR family transcriptional regulator [Asanoa ferruginea]|uniref:MarR family transcriptional regulator n=1 Tax=Asanoa ferruginea TaxID=53367 RepID=A0A3D9ZBT1_9ACTN|nr:MarR family winged helix-turn-helix transcriptional regulator [Asanoa ferruginea]REF94697.1 MarR family transcriptional regulator [Asanoa ferruginea]